MIRTAIEIKTAASTNAVTTTEAKTHLKVDFADATENAYIDALIVAAQQQIEAFTNRILKSTVCYYHLTGFPADGIILPFSPVSAIASVKYYSDSVTQNTWGATNYYYNINEEPCKIRYVGDSHPDTYEDIFKAVTVEFTVGYTTVPEALKAAIKLLVGDMYENRVDSPREKFTAWKMLAYPYRVFYSTLDNR